MEPVAALAPGQGHLPAGKIAQVKIVMPVATFKGQAALHGGQGSSIKIVAAV